MNEAKNLPACILSDAGKFYEILPCSMENFHKLCLKLIKFDSYNLAAAAISQQNFTKIMENFPCTFHKHRHCASMHEKAKIFVADCKLVFLITNIR